MTVLRSAPCRFLLARPLLLATLLLVGGDAAPVTELNQRAFEVLQCEKRLDIVPRATHLFEEPGALELIAQHAADWYRQHMDRP